MIMYFLKIMFENWNKSLHSLIQLPSFLFFKFVFQTGLLWKQKYLNRKKKT